MNHPQSAEQHKSHAAAYLGVTAALAGNLALSLANSSDANATPGPNQSPVSTGSTTPGESSPAVASPSLNPTSPHRDTMSAPVPPPTSPHRDTMSAPAPKPSSPHRDTSSAPESVAPPSPHRDTSSAPESSSPSIHRDTSHAPTPHPSSIHRDTTHAPKPTPTDISTTAHSTTPVYPVSSSTNPGKPNLASSGNNLEKDLIIGLGGLGAGLGLLRVAANRRRRVATEAVVPKTRTAPKHK